MRNIVTLLALILLLAACSKKEDATVVSNGALIDLQALTEVAAYLYEAPSIDQSIIKKIEAMIYGKVVSVAALQPEIAKLNGTSLKGLCAVVALSKKSSFGRALNDGRLSPLVTSYLASIEPQLKKRTDELKKTIFSDRDCAI